MTTKTPNNQGKVKEWEKVSLQEWLEDFVESGCELEDLESLLDQQREEMVEEIKQLANNLKVNINSNVDTRTMEYKAYLQRKGHNGALTLLHDSLDKLALSSDGEKKGTK